MIPVRRLPIAFMGLVLAFVLVSADASAARRHARHGTAHRAQVTTAIYQRAVRPHVPHRLHATNPHIARFAQAHRRVLMMGS